MAASGNVYCTAQMQPPARLVWFREFRCTRIRQQSPLSRQSVFFAECPQSRKACHALIAACVL